MKKYFDIQENDAGQRLDKYVLKMTHQLPKSFLQKAIRKKDIRVNGKRCEGGTLLKVGDSVSLYLPDEFFDWEPSMEFLKAPKELDVSYEDENLMVINKPKGLLMHSNSEIDTLLARALHVLYDKKEYLPTAKSSFTPAFCNRLDRNTQGLVLLAKNFPSLQLLNEKLRNREISRKYYCFVRGIMTQDYILKGYHQKDSQSNLVSIEEKEVPGSVPVETHVHLVKTFPKDNISFLEVELITGRSHQIRAHLSNIGHPLVGDVKYGDTLAKNHIGQQLCAYSVGFYFTPPSHHLEYLTNQEITLDCSAHYQGDHPVFF